MSEEVILHRLIDAMPPLTSRVADHPPELHLKKPQTF
jgi:hypothetical protein